MDTPRALGAALLVVAAVACDPSTSTPATSTAAPPASGEPCPLGVEGARVEAVDADGGVDLVLTSDAQSLEELRARARDAASMQGTGARKGRGHEGQHHLGRHGHGLWLTSLPPAEAHVEDVDGGVRIHLVALVPAQIDALRAGARERAERVNRASCDS
jgi:hypothetical protein